MNKLSTLLFFASLLLLTSCVKDNTTAINRFNDYNRAFLDTTGNVVVNEFVARGATYPNELGLPSDWIELYNTGDSAVDFSRTNYWISKDSANPKLYLLNQFTIQPKGYLVICADDSNQVKTQIHTNFGLNKLGSFIGLYKVKSDGSLFTTTFYPFGSQGSNISVGRTPDGGLNWTSFAVPTPGTKNQ